MSAVKELAIICPQPGPQEAFLATPADIAIYGGQAGGGKTWAMLFEPLRHIHRKDFRAMIFRRNATQISNPGGLWDASTRLYPQVGAHSTQKPPEWAFPSGAMIRFAHLDNEETKHSYQGAEIPLIGFDELCHFSAGQFWYMFSRLRSISGVNPYIRATCNPDADSWVADFISWWIDQNTGLAIPERSGVLRWFARINDTLFWSDTPDELVADHGADCMPKSVTFIAASVYDNKILMEVNPQYIANLKAMPLVEREQLLHGNWKIRPAAGLYFQRSWCKIVDAAPADLRIVRYWDLAATEKTSHNDPDFTTCAKLGKATDGRFYVLHGASMRKSPLHVQVAIKNTAEQDGRTVTVGLPQDPGQAGKSQAQDMARMLAGYSVKIRPESGSKVTRFGGFSAQCEAGNVFFVRGPWNDEFFDQLEGFPDAAHDDHADACSGAFNILMGIPRPAIIGHASTVARGN